MRFRAGKTVKRLPIAFEGESPFGPREVEPVVVARRCSRGTWRAVREGMVARSSRATFVSRSDSVSAWIDGRRGGARSAGAPPRVASAAAPDVKPSANRVDRSSPWMRRALSIRGGEDWLAERIPARSRIVRTTPCALSHPWWVTTSSARLGCSAHQQRAFDRRPRRSVAGSGSRAWSSCTWSRFHSAPALRCDKAASVTRPQKSGASPRSSIVSGVAVLQ